MDRDLIPLKVRIGLKGKHARYPNFNQLPCVQEAGIDWAYYVDTFGDGWHYDKVSGHKDNDVDSPYGQQWAVLLVPQIFADEAEQAFPTYVQIIGEAEFSTFYDERAHKHEPDEDLDSNLLSAIKQKQDLGIPLTPQQERALDPNNDERGIRKNKRRFWVDYKGMSGISIPPGTKTNKAPQDVF